ncbi:hypothetical protein OSCI_2140015 [Kamptonema sp. PCC 6506]|nr:hypothetical protein OSCI_2140015 [Kamptonema sp. PCC 6506]
MSSILSRSVNPDQNLFARWCEAREHSYSITSSVAGSLGEKRSLKISSNSYGQFFEVSNYTALACPLYNHLIFIVLLFHIPKSS